MNSETNDSQLSSQSHVLIHTHVWIFYLNKVKLFEISSFRKNASFHIYRINDYRILLNVL